MMESTPFITPVEPEPTATTFLQSQVPLVQSTQIVQQPVITSQIVSTPVASQVVSPPVPQLSYVPVAAVPQQVQPVSHTGVKVVPIYDDF